MPSGCRWSALMGWSKPLLVAGGASVGGREVLRRVPVRVSCHSVRRGTREPVNTVLDPKRGLTVSVRRPLAGLVILGPLLSACSTSATPPPSAGPTEAAPAWAPAPTPAPVAFTLKATAWWSGYVINVSHPDPPADTTAWMFGRPLDITPDGTRDFVLTRSFGVVPREPPNDPKGCLSTFVIGYVGFLIFGTNSRVDRTPHIGPRLGLGNARSGCGPRSPPPSRGPRPA